MSESELKEKEFVGKIWKWGEQLAIGIPQSQVPIFKKYRDRKLLVTVRVLTNKELEALNDE